MLDINYIRKVAKRAAHYAQVNGFEPKALCAADLQEGVAAIRDIPFLGDYVPPGWKFVRKYWVDSSGLGQEGEPALTVNQFLAAIRLNVLGPETHGYAILEAGQFQVYVGEYVKDDGHLALDTPERRDQERYFGEGQEPEQEDDNG